MYLSNLHAKSPFFVLAIFWAIMPFGQLLVGFIFESRLVPLWGGQSKLFFPGDLAIGIIMVGLVGLNTKMPIFIDKNNLICWHFAILALSLIIFIILRSSDIINYNSFSANSPTKWYHDVCGYFIMSYFVLSFGIPQIIRGIIQKDALYLDWIIVIIGVTIYGSCLIYDLCHGYTETDILFRHPANWHPLWRK